MRARLALHASGMSYELREVLLRDKPSCMLAASPKGSVPVLVLPDGQVIDESWDIMQWALHQQDPNHWLGLDGLYLNEAMALVNSNDGTFKYALDRYKYADRHPEQSQSEYRIEGEQFLRQLEERLQTSAYLLGDHLSIADAAVFPFIRQFAAVDQRWFDQSPYIKLRRWSEAIIHSALFAHVMLKHPVWNSGALPVVIEPTTVFKA